MAGGVRVGCDVQAIAPIAESIDRHGARYLDRVFTPAEQRICAQRAPSFAARYAAKEAVLKLLGAPDRIALLEVEILAEDSGRPVVELHGATLAQARERGFEEIDISLSHDAGFAFAVVVGALCDGSR